ncbi:hypothetical protein MLD38_015476 [Melastoma candidum]|uniref:Uncharacterized protein n=1 Tax=Melastoma candidum TaxID=119954 RepID=A0ACB9RI59_9MYRT|nr:hypothetical protein MLD38_015476 [Melastoma candidum]
MGDTDLGLSLSFPHHHHHHLPTTSAHAALRLNLMMPPCLHPSQLPLAPSDPNYKAQAFPCGIDVNRPPSVSEECEDDAGVSSPNSTMSTISGKRSERESNAEDPENERASSRGAMSDEDDCENSRKKLRLSKDQSAVLEGSFREHNTLNPKQKLALAKQLGLRPRQVEVWFQNRRARTKLKQTEVDCEFLKRCYENLTEENRRLHKEVQELRALKLSPHFFMRMSPPTTLTMCPSCQRDSGPSPRIALGP